MNNEKTETTTTQEPESFRDRIATVDEKGKRKWVYAQKPKGKFYLTWKETLPELPNTENVPTVL